MSCLETARADVHRIILDALGVLISVGEIPPELIPCFNARLCSAEFGNLTCNAALVCAAALGQTPQKLAYMICEAADLYGSCVSELLPTESGFINIRISNSVFDEDFGIKTTVTTITPNLNITVGCDKNDSSLDALKSAINADCFCRMVRYCGGNAEYIGKCFEKYSVLTDVHITENSEHCNKKYYVFSCNSSVSNTKSGDVHIQLKAARFSCNGRTARTHKGETITPETLTDELPAATIRYFFALDEPFTDIRTAYTETLKNPFYAIEKACSACNRALKADYYSQALCDNEKNIILLALTANDALRTAVSRKSVKNLCELAAALSRAFVTYYYADFRADKRVSAAVLETLEIILGILGIEAPKKI